MTQDEAIAILRKAGFDPHPVQQTGLPFPSPEHYRAAGAEWWDPGHPVRKPERYIAMPAARLITLAKAVLYASHDLNQWAAFMEQARFAAAIERDRRN